jgi:hypothetical protein
VLAGLPDGNYFGVGSGVVGRSDAVVAAADDLAIADYDGTKWTSYSTTHAFASQPDGLAHEESVIVGVAVMHGWRYSVRKGEAQLVPCQVAKAGGIHRGGDEIRPFGAMRYL